MKKYLWKAISLCLTAVFLFSILSSVTLAFDKEDYDANYINSNISLLKQHIKTHGEWDSRNFYRERYTDKLINGTFGIALFYYPETDELKLFFSNSSTPLYIIQLFFKSFDSLAHFEYSLTGSKDVDAHSADFSLYKYSDDNTPEIIIDSNVSETVGTDAKDIFKLAQVLAIAEWERLTTYLLGLKLSAFGFGEMCKNHTFNATKTEEPTCYKTGHQYYVCSSCGLYNVEELPMTEHKSINRDGVCESCGQTVVDVSSCSCSCHKDDFFSKLITAFKMIFWKLFRTNQICSCGTQHY